MNFQSKSTADNRFYRRGPIHRSIDEYISFREVRQRFGFRTVKIGRWVTVEEQQAAAVRFYDALCDLQLILQVPSEVISLRGNLALHYGTGGRPGVAAHYSPMERAFALAKNAGPGSIAHEWFHAFDHYITAKAFPNVSSNRFASVAWLENEDLIHHPLNQKLSNIFRRILLSDDDQHPSELFQHSINYDRTSGRNYYSMPEEMCARSFEAFVQDATIKNAFLVKGTQQSEEAKLGLYPQGIQRQSINAAMADYFASLGEILKG